MSAVFVMFSIIFFRSQWSRLQRFLIGIGITLVLLNIVQMLEII